MKRTGNSKIAVVGWGRGMGHKGHMYLADAVISQAHKMGADPYFFVSKTVGKDDPLFPEEKIKIYQKVFPQQATIFTAEGNLNQALQDIAGLGYQGVVVVVGADQKDAFKYLEKPNKEGVPVYQSFGFKKLKVISRQETPSKYAKVDGPRATPMREKLMDPYATDEDKFKVWRDAMPDSLGDSEVLDLMRKAEARLMGSHTKAKKLEESLIMHPDAKINVYYIAPAGQRLTVAKGITYPLLQKLVIGLKKKYNIDMGDLEIRPVDANQYSRSSLPDLAEEQLDEFAPDNGDDDRPTAEYEVYQCQPNDQFDWIGGPLMQTDDMGKAHTFAYFLWKKHPDKCFMIWQERSQGSRGGYGPKGSVLAPSKEVDEGVAEGYSFKGGFPFDVDHMPGAVIRNRDETSDVVKTKNKDKWDDEVDRINDEVFDDMADFRTNSEGETVTGNSAVWAKWDNATQTGWINRKGQQLKPWPVKEQEVEEAGITRRGILKGIAGAGALGAAGKAGAIAGAFPSPSTREKWAKDAAASNAAEARRQAELKAKADKERLAKNTPDVERLNKVNYHGKDAPQPSNATWDGDSDFMDIDGTQYAMASRMPIRGDVPPDMKLIVTQEGRQVYIWTRNSLKGNKGHYFYPAEKPSTIDEDYLDE